MKLATLVAAAAFALVGASSAFAGNSAVIDQFNTNGNNSIKSKQVGRDNFLSTGQVNVNGDNRLKNKQIGPNNALEAGQSTVNGNNSVKNIQRNFRRH